MNYRLLVIQALALIITGGVSSLVYFFASYSNKSLLSKLFVPKNDSIWEHIKVLLAPILLASFVTIFSFNITPNYMFAVLLSTIFIVMLNPITFWLLYKFTTWDMIKINITTNVLSLLVGYLFFIYILLIPPLTIYITIISSVGLLLILSFYIMATFYPTKDFIFLDPETKKDKEKKDE